MRLKAPVVAPFTVLLIYFLTMLVLFNFWRLVFTLYYWNELNFGALTLYFQPFSVAFRLDALIIGFLTLPILFTIYLPRVGWTSLRYRKLFSIYLFISIFASSVILVVDIYFFEQFTSHLNMLALMYSQGGMENWTFIWGNYPIIRASLLVLIIAFLFFKISSHNIGIIEGPPRPLWLNISYLSLSAILILAACRGGFQKKPLDWTKSGHASFSSNAMANQIAQTPMFTFFQSLKQLSSETKLKESLTFYDPRRALLMT